MRSTPVAVSIMKILGFALLGLFVALIVFQVIIRVAKKFHHVPCPWQVGGILDNPFRRRFMSSSKTLDQIGVSKGMCVLELGPGPGFLTVEAAQRAGSPGRLYCLDIQPEMLAETRRKLMQHGSDNAGLILGDAKILPLVDDCLDLAFLVGVLGEISDKKAALRELHRVLRHGGVLSVTEMLPDPDYSLRSTTIARCRRAGFEPFEKLGNFFVYTINFIKV